jgi:sugar phosphate isomerase/epimerase
MRRRTFLFHAAAGTAGLTLFPALLSGCRPEHDPLHDFGLITNVVGKLIRKDHRGTMAMLAGMGYKYLEFGGTWDEKPSELRAYMDQIGLIPLAGGSSISGLQGDGLKQNIDMCLEMGKRYLVCYWPWMDDGNSPTWEKVKFAADESNRMGRACNEQGLRFALHNHDLEFRSLEGRVIYGFILENTDPELVTMEIDLYWAYKGGAELREYFQKYPGRFELVHVKDTYDSPDRESFACVGSGIIDFQDLFSYRDVAGFRHLIVENDRPGEDEEGCARSSIEYLRSLDF